MLGILVNFIPLWKHASILMIHLNKEQRSSFSNETLNQKKEEKEKERKIHYRLYISK